MHEHLTQSSSYQAEEIGDAGQAAASPRPAPRRRRLPAKR
jgi:hypothetical protein